MINDYAYFLNTGNISNNNFKKSTELEEALSKTMDPSYLMIIAANTITAYMLDTNSNNKYLILALNNFANLYLYNLIAVRHTSSGNQSIF